MTHLRNLIRRTTLCLSAALISAAPTHAADFTPAPQAFRQEISRAWPLPAASPNGFTVLDVAPDGVVRVADGQQWFALRAGQWEAVPRPANASADTTEIFIGGASRTVPTPLAELHQIHRADEVVWLATAKGVLRVTATGSANRELADHDVRQVATGPGGVVLAATARGLWQRNATGNWELIRATDEFGRVWTDNDVRGVTINRVGTWWVATPAGVIRRVGNQWSFFTGREGLPYADFTGAVIGEDTEVWFGTHRGAVRFDGQEWAYREGPLWLPSNDVRSLAADADGRVWFATDKGLGCIERRAMTLAEKAAYYEQEIERYIKRTPTVIRPKSALALRVTARKSSTATATTTVVDLHGGAANVLLTRHAGSRRQEARPTGV